MNLTVFNYEEKQVRTVRINGEIWFVLKDICDVLNVVNHRDITARLDDDEKGVDSIYTLGGPQEMIIISESGLYSVILRSDKPEAKPFRKWVTSEVLPSIHKTGKYEVKKEPTLDELMASLPERWGIAPEKRPTDEEIACDFLNAISAALESGTHYLLPKHKQIRGEPDKILLGLYHGDTVTLKSAEAYRLYEKSASDAVRIHQLIHILVNVGVILHRGDTKHSKTKMFKDKVCAAITIDLFQNR